MYSTIRSRYIVLKDFTTTFPVAQTDVELSYRVGEGISLRDDGTKVRELLKKGYVRKFSLSELQSNNQ